MKARVSPPNGISCPYKECPSLTQVEGASPKPGHVVRNGSFHRSSDSKRVSRFVCRDCDRTFSRATTSPCFRQKKRKLNDSIRVFLASGVSQRRCAKILNINRKTVVRKFLFLGAQAIIGHKKFLEDYFGEENRCNTFEFDELETFERSKCLPLSVPLVVGVKTRKILGFRVASMPAKGLLAGISVKKYGRREDHRAEKTAELFEEIKPYMAPHVDIITDQNPKYPSWLRARFPKMSHKAHKGRRGCAVAQGELKKIGFDPLFDLNHSCAMLRANINRLFRRTWCTTKKPDRLNLHIAIYVQYHNLELT